MSIFLIACELLFYVVLLATWLVVLNRLYVGLRYGEVSVRSGSYSRHETPRLYWSTIASLLIGLIFLFLVTDACVSLALS